MTLILGLDIATTTGWALYSSGEPLSTMRTGLIKLPPKKKGEFVCPIDRGVELSVLFRRFMITLKNNNSLPQFAAIEAPFNHVQQYDVKPKNKDKQGSLLDEGIDEAASEGKTINAHAAFMAYSLVNGVATILRGYNVPYMLIADTTWRKSFLGFGRKKGFTRKEWKQAAIDKCRFLRIDVANNDAAEAAGVAFAASGTQRFTLFEHELRQRQNKQVAA